MFENVDGRTDAGVIGILIAHLGAFGSGELKNMFDNMDLAVTDVVNKCFNQRHHDSHLVPKDLDRFLEGCTVTLR